MGLHERPPTLLPSTGDAMCAAGEAKIKKAREHGTKMIDEDGLLEMIRASCPQPGVQEPLTPRQDATTGGCGPLADTLDPHRPQSNVADQDLSCGTQPKDCPNASPSASPHATVASTRGRARRTVQRGRPASHVESDSPSSKSDSDGDYHDGSGGGSDGGSDDEAASSSQAVRSVPGRSLCQACALFRREDRIVWTAQSSTRSASPNAKARHGESCASKPLCMRACTSACMRAGSAIGQGASPRNCQLVP
jgi:hypothetical protein